MEDNGGSKVTGIRQIVRLKEFLQKWQNVTLSPRGTNVRSNNENQVPGGISPAISRRLRSSDGALDFLQVTILCRDLASNKMNLFMVGSKKIGILKKVPFEHLLQNSSYV
ncbi:Uncharacterized protein Fot_37220 [Forsythia ovata]|uniref:Uncharacterized protein n=1 Tax=Forsythia ovata TaxID=205694 RepID=A0ABD1SRN1_9LAMI